MAAESIGLVVVVESGVLGEAESGDSAELALLESLGLGLLGPS